MKERTELAKIHEGLETHSRVINALMDKTRFLGPNAELWSKLLNGMKEKTKTAKVAFEYDEPEPATIFHSATDSKVEVLHFEEQYPWIDKGDIYTRYKAGWFIATPQVENPNISLLRIIELQTESPIITVTEGLINSDKTHINENDNLGLPPLWERDYRIDGRRELNLDDITARERRRGYPGGTWGQYFPPDQFSEAVKEIVEAVLSS